MLEKKKNYKMGPHLWQIRAVRDCFWLLILGLAIWCVWLLWDVFLPAFVALLFAYLVNPLQNWTAQHWHWSRTRTALIILLVTGVLVIACFVGFTPVVAEQIKTLQDRLPQYLTTIASKNGIELNLIYQRMQHWGSAFENPQALIEQVVDRASRTLSVLTHIIGQAASWALLLILIPIYFYFFSRGFDRGVAYLDDYIPRRHRDEVHLVLDKMDKVTASFFRGRLLVALIMIAMFAIGWWATAVPYWFLLSIFAGLFSIVPYASGIFWPLAILLKYVDLVTSGGQVTAMDVLVWPSVVFLVVQFAEGWLITPWIQSGSLNMSVPSVLLFVFIGGSFGGVLGLFLAIPIAACLKIVLEDVILPRLRKWAHEH